MVPYRPPSRLVGHGVQSDVAPPVGGARERLWREAQHWRWLARTQFAARPGRELRESVALASREPVAISAADWLGGAEVRRSVLVCPGARRSVLSAEVSALEIADLFARGAELVSWHTAAANTFAGRRVYRLGGRFAGLVHGGRLFRWELPRRAAIVQT